MEIVIGVAGAILSIVTFAIGERRADRRHARERARQGHGVVREYVTLIKPLIQEVRKKRDHFDRVRRGSGDLYGYFRNESSIVSPEDIASLRVVIGKASHLDQDCADAWYYSLRELSRIQDEHSRLVNLAAVGSLPPNLGDGEAYRRELVAAEDAIRSALNAAIAHSADDTQVHIESILEEM